MFARSMSLLSIIVAVSSATAGPNFALLGRLPNAAPTNKFSSSASGVSNDGKVVVGMAQSVLGLEAFRWTPSTGIVGLGDDPAGAFGSRATAVSGNGQVIVGGVTTNVVSYQTGARWTESTGWQNLPFLSNSVSFPFLSPIAVSEDGSIIGGTGRITTGNVGFRYTAADGFTTTGHLATVDSGSMSGMSGDGRVIIGSSGNNGPTQQAYRWTQADGIQAINGLSGRPTRSADAISNDGRVVVGTLAGPPTVSTFLWTEGVGIEDLGRFPVTNDFVRVLDVNQDGTILIGEVGNSPTGFGAQYAVLWTRQDGFRYLQDVATQDLGIELGDWRLASASGISPDGRWIVGAAENSLGNREAFLLHVPEASPLSMISMAASVTIAIGFMQRWRSRSKPEADWPETITRPGRLSISQQL
jgi:probable HAF family extracellular repeat protein